MIEIENSDLLELITYARRYCDGRNTYAPFSFNAIYQKLKFRYPNIFPDKDEFDLILTNKGQFWPYAQDGHYDASTGNFDAISKKEQLKQSDFKKICPDCNLRYVKYYGGRFSKRCIPCTGQLNRTESRNRARRKVLEMQMQTENN